VNLATHPHPGEKNTRLTARPDIDIFTPESSGVKGNHQNASWQGRKPDLPAKNL